MTAVDWLRPANTVYHRTFGAGMIDRVDAGSVQVHFDRVGRKNVRAEFLSPAPPTGLSGFGATATEKIEPVDLWARVDPPALPAGVLPDVIERFATVRGEMMGCDPAGLAIAALSVCSALISDRIKLRMKRHDDYTECARLWVALVGLPSTKKSPAIGAAVKPLFALDAELAREHRLAMARYEEMKKAGEPAVRPPNRRLRIEDVTVEKSQEIIADSPDGVLCFQDELTRFFGSMEPYSGAKGASADRGYWLQAYNGGSYSVARVGRGQVEIENLSVCLLGGVQPDVMRRIAGDTQDDGLLQRMIPVVLRPATLGKDEPMPDVAREYAWLARRLHEMQPPLRGGGGNLGDLTTELVLDDDAQAIRLDLEGWHMDMSGLEIVNRKLASAIGKYDGLFGRLCVAFHCIDNAGEESLPRVVTGGTAQRVAALLHSFLLPHAIAFYREIVGLSDDHELLTEVAGFILAHPEEKEMTFRNFGRGSSMMRRCKDARAAEVILERLEGFGWLYRKPLERNQSANRWMVLPQVHTVFAERAKKEKARREKVREMIAEICREAAE
ncbi:DUF3987 domain-containing protein [Aureimonas leprariae]|nr:DUF3987 domain-containing protein [Aureimonas leprariae]